MLNIWSIFTQSATYVTSYRIQIIIIILKKNPALITPSTNDLLQYNELHYLNPFFGNRLTTHGLIRAATSDSYPECFDSPARLVLTEEPENSGYDFVDFVLG